MDHAKKNVRMIPRKEGKEREGRLAERQGGREGARKRGIQVNLTALHRTVIVFLIMIGVGS